MTTIADRHLYLTADRDHVVEEGDDRAAFLFATPGTEISDDDVKKYGIGPKRARMAKQASTPADKRGPAGSDKGA